MDFRGIHHLLRCRCCCLGSSKLEPDPLQSVILQALSGSARPILPGSALCHQASIQSVSLQSLGRRCLQSDVPPNLLHGIEIVHSDLVAGSTVYSRRHVVRLQTSKASATQLLAPAQSFQCAPQIFPRLFCKRLRHDKHIRPTFFPFLRRPQGTASFSAPHFAPLGNVAWQSGTPA